MRPRTGCFLFCPVHGHCRRAHHDGHAETGVHDAAGGGGGQERADPSDAGLFRGTVYVGTPSLAEYLIEQAPKILNKSRRVGLQVSDVRRRTRRRHSRG